MDEGNVATSASQTEEQPKVSLEPYPNPLIQAIGPEGYEYPARTASNADNFWTMVKDLDLIRRAMKRRKHEPQTDGKDQQEDPRAGLMAALRSVDEALKELVIAVDTMHVVRSDAAFIGHDSLTGYGAVKGVTSLPTSHISPEVIISMKKQSLARASSDLSTWASKATATLQRTRQLADVMTTLRRRARVAAVASTAPTTEAPLAMQGVAPMQRPLSVTDTICVVTDGQSGPRPVPFRISATGAPTLPMAMCEKGQVVKVEIVHGPTRARGAWMWPSVGGSGDGGVEGRVRALQLDAVAKALMSVLQKDVAGMPGPLVDRHGIAARTYTSTSDAYDGSRVFDAVDGGVGEGGGGGVQFAVQQPSIVGFSEWEIKVELDADHVMTIGWTVEKGAGRAGDINGGDVEEQKGGSAEQSNGAVHVTGRADKPRRLRSLSRVALVHALDHVCKRGLASASYTTTSKPASGPTGLLQELIGLLSHRQYADEVARAAAAAVRRLNREGVKLRLLWKDLDMNSAASTLVIVDDDGQMGGRVAVVGATVCRVKCDYVDGVTQAVVLSLPRDVAEYLEGCFRRHVGPSDYDDGQVVNMQTSPMKEC